MRLHYYVLLSASASLIGSAEAYLPKLYTWGMALSQHLLVRNGYRMESGIVFVSQSSQSLFDIVKDCKTAEGKRVDAWECANSIVQSGCAVALAACAYHRGEVCTLPFHFAHEIISHMDLVLISLSGCYKEERFGSRRHPLQISK